MLPNKYKTEDLDKDFGKRIDELIKIKTDAKMTLTRSTIELLEMGAKILLGNQITALPNFNARKYLDWNYQEFAWTAIFKDGSVIKQFEDDGTEHHFGHIDQSKLSKFQWISCYEYETDNKFKEVVVELDFETGKFSFQNGFAPQETRNVSDKGYPAGESPKLVMKMVKRNSEAVNLIDQSRGETIKYNRYLIGWETETDKVILCVEPNGFTHIWHRKEN